MQIKTTMEYYLTPVRMLSKRQEITNGREYLEKRELSYTVGGSGNVNWYSHLKNSMEVSQKN